MVPAALAYPKDGGASEMCILLDCYLTGTRVHMRWYRQLEHVRNAVVPARYRSVSTAISREGEVSLSQEVVPAALAYQKHSGTRGMRSSYDKYDVHFIDS